MIKEYDNFLNCKQHLRDNIPMLIELFVSYYGEDRRKEIEEKFTNAIFIAYRKPKTTSIFLKKISEELSTEIITHYTQKLNITLPVKKLFEYELEYDNIQPIKFYQDFYELYQLGPEGRIQKFKENALFELRKYLPQLTNEEFEEMIRTQTILPKYNQVNRFIIESIKYYININHVEEEYKKSFNKCKELMNQIDPNITIENYTNYLDNKQIQQLNLLLKQLPVMLSEYNERMSRYSSYQKETDEDKIMEERISTDYYTKFLEENIDLLSQEDINTFEEYKKHPGEAFRLSKRIHYLFGYSLNSLHPLDAFSEEAESIVQTEKKDNWKRKSLIESRIEFFQKHGIDLGNDYEAYVNSEEAKKIWPTTERVAKFLESRNRLLNEYNIAYYESSPAYLESRKEIEAMHFLDKDDSFNASIFASNQSKTFVNPNIIQTEEGYRIYPLIVVNCSYNSGNIDHDIIHELNHLFESSLKSVEGNYYSVISGWDKVNGSINQSERIAINTLETDDTKRKYELFSEIINEEIAQEICEIKHQKHQYIFDTEENEEYKHTTSYEHTFFLVKEFFEEFKEEIIASRRNGNIQIIWDTVGKENFDELNDLFHVFYENFSGFRIYNVIESLKNKEDTPETRIYLRLNEKKKEILQKMRLYSMTHKKESPVEENSKENESINY